MTKPTPAAPVEGAVETAAEQAAAAALALAADDKLTVAQLKTFAETVPKFVEAAVEAIKTSGAIASTAADSHSAAFATLQRQQASQDRILDAIAASLPKMESDAARLQVNEMLLEAFKINAASAETVSKMNESNNSTFGSMADTAGKVGLAVLGIGLLAASAAVGAMTLKK
jgi:hypothetical protein